MGLNDYSYYRMHRFFQEYSVPERSWLNRLGFDGDRKWRFHSGPDPLTVMESKRK